MSTASWRLRSLLVIATVALMSGGCAWVQRVNVDSAGNPGSVDDLSRAISADGRYIAFDSYSSLVTDDTNNALDVFVRDTVARTTTRVSVDSAGNQANDFSEFPAISANGRYIGFSSAASNLVAGDTNGASDVFVRDTVAGTTTRVSVDSAGNQANDASFSNPAISADGRYVAFDSDATNLVAGDSNSERDVFVRDMVAGTTTRISVDSAGNEGNDASYGPAISADGRYVAFSSAATNLIAGDTNNKLDVFVRDTAADTTTRISIGRAGNQANDDSYLPAISADGRYVAFISAASNLVAGDTNHAADVVVRANPEPAVTGITPSSLPRGATTPVAIAGSGFITGASVVIDGNDHTVSNVHVVSPTEITANVTVDSDAALTARNVWVELPGTGPGFGAGALGVCASCVTVN